MEHKRYTLRFRQINKDTFDAIKARKKRIETRAATTKYAHIHAGDELVFVCDKERFQMKVRSANIYKGIPALLKKYKPKQINPKVTTAKELTDMYHSFPGYEEKIRKFGIIALELE